MHREEIKKCLQNYLDYPHNKVVNVEKLFIAICNYIFSIEEISGGTQEVQKKDQFTFDLKEFIKSEPKMRNIEEIHEDFIYLKEFSEKYQFCSGCTVCNLLRDFHETYTGCYRREADGRWLIKPLKFIHRIATKHTKPTFAKRAKLFLKLQNIQVECE